MHDVFQYLKAKWILWAFGLAAMALVPFMAYLGGQDVALGCYVSLILGFLLALLLFVDGRSYVARLRQLRAICAHLEALPEALPAPQDALDAANQAVIRALAAQLAQTSRALEAAQREDLSVIIRSGYIRLKRPLPRCALCCKMVLRRRPMCFARSCSKSNATRSLRCNM